MVAAADKNTTAVEPKNATTAAAVDAPKTETRTIAQYTGFHGTTRVLTKEDQATLRGTPGKTAGLSDLVWEKGNSKVDVTDIDSDVLEYLDKTDDEFKVTSKEIPVEEAPAGE